MRKIRINYSTTCYNSNGLIIDWEVLNNKNLIQFTRKSYLNFLLFLFLIKNN